MKAKRLDNQLRKKGISDDRLYFHRYRLSNEEYHQITQAVGSSVLKDLYETQNPAYCHARHIAKTVPNKQTDALIIGSATHKFILERRSFNKEFAVFEGPRRSGPQWKTFIHENPNKTILTSKQFGDIQRLRDAVLGHAEASRLLAGGEAEKSVLWRDEETGILCKARADYIKQQGDNRILIDLKTTLCAEPIKFTRDLIKLNYPIQEHHYRSGFEATDFAFICVEKGDFNSVVVYDLDDAFDHCGHIQYRQTLEQWAKHVDKDYWPVYDGEPIKTLYAPEYYQNRILHGER